MDTLNKTIKKLNEPEYQELLSAVAGRKNNKPYLVLEAARKENYDETQMMEMLSVNPSTYYTLKSRLNERIAQYLSKNVKNPISALKDKVAMVPAMLFSNDREVAIRALKNLEKQLIEYDLSNELIVVYKVLARLSMYNGDFDYYEKEYNRHVAYSLAVVKAEDLFYDFVWKLFRQTCVNSLIFLSCIKVIVCLYYTTLSVFIISAFLLPVQKI